MTLSEALSSVYGHHKWTNPINGIGYVSGVFQTPYEAYTKLKPEYQQVVRNILGREPEEYEDLIGEAVYMDYEYMISTYGSRSQKEALEEARALTQSSQ